VKRVSCPFCGSSRTRLQPCIRIGWWHVVCEGCGAEGPASTVKENARRGWNDGAKPRERRPTPWIRRPDGACPENDDEARLTRTWITTPIIRPPSMPRIPDCTRPMRRARRADVNQRLPRWLEALRMMRDQDEEMVYERGQCYVGLEKFSGATFFRLLRLVAISEADHSRGVGGLERYRINETGEAMLNRLP